MKVGAACLIIVNPFELVWDRNKPDRMLFLVAFASNSISVDLYSENPYALDVCRLIEHRAITDVNSDRRHIRYHGLGTLLIFLEQAGTFLSVGMAICFACLNSMQIGNVI